MASDWVSLSEVCEIRRGSSPRPIVNFISEKSGMPWVKIADATGDASRYITKTNQFIKHEGVSKSVIVEKGDLILSNSGTAGLPKFMGITACIHDGWQVLKNLDGITSNYLYYSLIYIRPFLLHHAYDSVMKNLTLDMVRNARIKLPPLPEQKLIANILGTLDDKIELNRQMNETLEAMAQALFKSWFVDFDPVIDNALVAGKPIPEPLQARAEQRQAIDKKDNLDIQNLFPNEFEFSEEMGWIPKGWSVKCIKDIGKVVTGKTPPKKIDNAYSEHGIPFITPTDIDELPFVIYTNRYLSEDGVQAVKNSRISAGSICVTCIGSQMGKTTISPLASVSNQQINSITGCNQFWRNYLFFNLRRRRDEIFLLGSSGSTMPILNKSNFEAFPILCPSEKLLSSLDSNFQSTIDSILENTKQNQTLAKLRDTLLPKLMSGELRIADAAAMVEDA
ncbi:MAG: restriction endonuclease subunit S [Psychrobacter sp.]